MVHRLTRSTMRADSQPWTVKLGREEVDIHCKFINTSEEAENIFKSPNVDIYLGDFDIILLDNDWGEIGREITFGLDLLKYSQSRRSRGPFIAIFTAASSFNPQFVSDALSAGADALIDKRELTHLLNVLVAAMERKRSRMELEQVRKLAGILVESDPALVSRSPTMQKALQEAALLAPFRKEPILIVGEVGTGKTRIAKAIHGCSPSTTVVTNA